MIEIVSGRNFDEGILNEDDYVPCRLDAIGEFAERLGGGWDDPKEGDCMVTYGDLSVKVATFFEMFVWEWVPQGDGGYHRVKEVKPGEFDIIVIDGDERIQCKALGGMVFLPDDHNAQSNALWHANYAA